jgi:hypothetical protein
MAQAWVYALVGIAVLQALATVVLYYYLGRRARPPSPADSVTPTPPVDDAAQSTADAAVDGEGVVCPNCGTTNEPGYRYCRQCVQQLGRAPARADGDEADAWLR